MSAEMLALRLVHVVGGVFWVGSMMLNTFYVIPAMTAAGAAAGPVMAGFQKRGLFTALPLAAVLTLLSGIRLLWIASAGFSAAYFESGTGLAFAIGGAAAILAFIIGMLVARPAAMRGARLGAELASADDAARPGIAQQLAAVRQRAAVSGMVVMLLLMIAVSAMAVARYV